MRDDDLLDIPAPPKVRRINPRAMAKRLLNAIEWQRRNARMLLARADELEEQVQLLLYEQRKP